MKWTQSTAKGAILLIIGTMPSKILGFIGELVDVYQFGADHEYPTSLKNS